MNNAGAMRWLTKPIDRARLSTTLESFTRADGPRDVLVIEDEPSVRELVRRTLAADGWRVRETDHGSGAPLRWWW